MHVYSQDEVVATVTSYYEFLVSMYLHEGDLVRPPAGGWPEISQARLGYLGKTDTAIELLRHLPYIRRDSEDQLIEVYDHTICVDYRGEYMKEFIESEGDYYSEPVPEIGILGCHTVCLARPPESDGCYIFLDTEKGVVTLLDSDGALDPTELSEHYPRGHDEYWRNDPTYTVPELFKLLKGRFEDCQIVPLTQIEVGWVDEVTGRAETDIFRKHGWPSRTSYDKLSCLKELKTEYGKLHEGSDLDELFPTLKEEAEFPSMRNMEEELR